MKRWRRIEKKGRGREQTSDITEPAATKKPKTVKTARREWRMERWRCNERKRRWIKVEWKGKEIKRKKFLRKRKRLQVKRRENYRCMREEVDVFKGRERVESREGMRGCGEKTRCLLKRSGWWLMLMRPTFLFLTLYPFLKVKADLREFYRWRMREKMKMR